MTGLFKKSPEKIARKKALSRKKEFKKLVKEKKFGKVLDVGEEILEKLPDDLDVLFILGGIYNMRGKHKTAISYFDRALKYSSYDPGLLLMKAKSLLELGRFDESKLCCDKLLEIDPKNKAVQTLLEKIEND